MQKMCEGFVVGHLSLSCSVTNKKKNQKVDMNLDTIANFCVFFFFSERKPLCFIIILLGPFAPTGKTVSFCLCIVLLSPQLQEHHVNCYIFNFLITFCSLFLFLH